MSVSKDILLINIISRPQQVVFLKCCKAFQEPSIWVGYTVYPVTIWMQKGLFIITANIVNLDILKKECCFKG